MTVQIHTLANGFRIVTERMPGLASASVGIWVSAGGRHERVEETGIAHFLEHMAFKGTASRTARDIAEVIEDVGGYINAYTGREMTAYYARVLGEHVPLAIDVIADILLNPAFAPDEIEVERGVILQEIGQSHDTPDDVIFDWLQEVAYPDQSLGRPILGTPDRIRAFDKGAFQGFVARHYGPERLILSAAGDVDHDAVVAAAEALFAALPSGPKPNLPTARYAGGERRVEKDLEQAHVALGLSAPGYRDADIYTAQILSVALGGGMSSRLFQELRERRGLCYTIFAQHGAFDETGLFTIYAGTGADSVAELVNVTVDELRRTAADLSEREVERARAQMKAGLVMGLESPSARAERLARMLTIWGNAPSLEETLAKIDAVTLADTHALARQLCTGAPPALALYGPVSAAPAWERVQAALAA